MRDPLSCRYLSFAEREEIAMLRAEGKGVREIARGSAGRRRRSPGSCGATRRREAAARVPGVGGAVEGRAGGAPPKTAKLAADERLREYVQDRLAGKVRPARRDRGGGPGGRAVEGPQQAASPGPPVGECVEPGADLGPAARSTSPMIRRCGSRTRRSTSRCSCRAAARCTRADRCLRTGRALRVPRARAGAAASGSSPTR